MSIAAEDLHAIHALLADYCRHLDAGREDEWLALFADDGRLVVGAKAFEGVNGLRAFLGGRKGGGLHLNTLPHLTFVDDDAVETEIPFFGLQPGEDGDAWVRGVGQYRDRLRRGPQGWRFAERRVVLADGF